MKGKHLSLADILTRRWRTFVITGTALSALVVLGYWLQPLRYETYGVYRPKKTEQREIQKGKNSDILKQLDFLDDFLNQVFLQGSDITPEARLIKGDDNLQRAIESLNILDHEGNLASSRSLRRRISLSSSDKGKTVKIGLYDPDPAKAQKLVDRLMALYVERFGAKTEAQAINFQSLIQPQLVNGESLLKQSQQALYQIQLGSEPTPLAPSEKAGDLTLDLQSIRISAQQQLSTSGSEISMLQGELGTSLSDRKILLQEVISLAKVRQDVLNLLLTILDQPRDSNQIPSLLNSLEVKTLDLKKNLTVSQTIYNKFSEDQTSSWVISQGQNNPVSIIKAATTPTEGYRPYKKWFIGLGLILGLIGGAIASWIKERQDNSFLSLADIYAYTKLPIYGVIPHFSHKARRFQLLARENGGSYPDAVTAFRSSEGITENFEVASLGRLPQVIAFTSTTRKEGTSLATANLAYFLAKQGKKVLIIDANLYHPQQHALWNRPQSLGLCDCMAGEAQLGKTLQRLQPNLDLLQAGYTHKNKDIVLNSPGMSILIKEFRARYEHILVDTPAFEVSIHSYLIANSADATVLLVHPDKINLKRVLTLKETEERTSKKLWGMIINDSSQNPKSSKTIKLMENSQWDANLRLQKQVPTSDLEISTLSALNPHSSLEDESTPILAEGRSRENQENYLYNLPLDELHKLVDALWDSWSHDLELLLEQEEEVVQQSRKVSELQETIDQGNAYRKLTSELQIKEEKEKLDLLADTFIGQRPRLMEVKQDLMLYKEVLLARTDAEQIPTPGSRNPMRSRN